ncbi:MAG: hypothetical protein Q9218_004581 [Villophora microphyllina]
MFLLSPGSIVLVAWFLTICSGYVIDPGRMPLTIRNAQVTLNLTILDTQTVNFNGWEISSCGLPQSPTPQLNSMLGFLYQMRPHLEAVINDAHQGVRSPHGYAAFFKTSINARRVISIYQNLVDANPVIVSEERAKITKTRTPQPRFECINENDPVHANITLVCNRGHESGVTIINPFIIFPGIERIAVCPTFFKINQYPPPGTACPSLDSEGKFQHGDMTLMHGGFAYVVYTLAMMYNRDMYELKQNNNHLTDMQEAIDLNSRMGLHNAENFGFYAGAVQGNCKAFPKRGGRLDEGLK